MQPRGVHFIQSATCIYSMPVAIFLTAPACDEIAAPSGVFARQQQRRTCLQRREGEKGRTTRFRVTCADVCYLNYRQKLYRGRLLTGTAQYWNTWNSFRLKHATDERSLQFVKNKNVLCHDSHEVAYIIVKCIKSCRTFASLR